MAEPSVPVEEVAKHLGVAKGSVYRWIGLPAHDLGRRCGCGGSESYEWGPPTVGTGTPGAHEHSTTRGGSNR